MGLCSVIRLASIWFGNEIVIDNPSVNVGLVSKLEALKKDTETRVLVAKLGLGRFFDAEHEAYVIRTRK